jgi:acetolactate synthase-1/2/3 large subunit
MKLTDYLVEALVEAGVKIIFGVTGGSIVHPLHSAEKNDSLKVVYTHHEQAASFAADAVAHFPGQIGACFVTTGPGGTNAITGLTSAWLDSVPVIFISGQARSEHLTGPQTVRQIGSQHIDIISVVKPLTKFAKTITNPLETRKIVEEAIYLCMSGRPGPVWIDIPLDLQWVDIDISAQEPFIKEPQSNINYSKDLKILMDELKIAKNPLFILGFGVKLSGLGNQFLEMLEGIRVPCVLTWNTLDMLDSQSPLNLGLIGTAGSRDANLAVHYADLVVAFGSHLSNQLIGNNPDEFAPFAKVIVIDIDAQELARLPVRFIKINEDLKGFIPALNEEFTKSKFILNSSGWNKKCEEFKSLRNFGINISKGIEESYVGQYYFYNQLSSVFQENDSVVVDGGGNTLFSALNSLRLKRGQHIVCGAGIGCMGSGLPHSIGASLVLGGGKVYCLIGDGSMQFNIQELATIELLNLPIKIIIINNGGYKAIMDTQDSFFDCRFGVDQSTGLSLPSYAKVADAYNIPYFRLDSELQVDSVLTAMSLNLNPCICEVFVDPSTPLLPRGGFVKAFDGSVMRLPLHDMFPVLPREIKETF